MNKIFISQPMSSKSMEEIITVRKAATVDITTRFPEAEIVEHPTLFDDNFEGYLEDSFQSGHIQHKQLARLGLDIATLAQCDAIYCCAGWRGSRGCMLEYNAALFYGLHIIYEEVKTNEDSNGTTEVRS
jgi:hypothetical protein